jgi:hypothetical protein
MNAPKWVIEKRIKICTECEYQKSCDKRFTILQALSHCPANKWKNANEEIKERAWPESAARVSGCCDSALNYGD